jgi:CBS domain containing-hemolysin-like protein
MSAGSILAMLGFAACTSAGFFFALAETALFSLGRWQARQLAEREPGRGGRVGRMLAQPQDLLATIVLGNTFASAGLVTLGVWLVLHQGWGSGAVLFLLLGLILVAGEVIPKTLAVRAPDFWAVQVAAPMEALQSLTRPFRRVAQGLDTWLLRWLVPASFKPLTAPAEEDYAELLELGCQQGALAESEKEIILQIISLDRRTAREVMKPRAQMCALPDDLSREELVAAARRCQHRRLPLYDGTPDTIVGILNTRKLLLEPEGDLAEAIEFPSFVPEAINLLQLLKSMQRQQRGVAIVLDEYGTTAGLVTIEDILGSLIGRIRVEGEPEGFVMERLGPGRWRINGTMRLEDFRREYPELMDAPGVDTMGGLLVDRAQVVPPVGGSVRWGALRLSATIADERRVRELLVELVPAGEGAA